MNEQGHDKNHEHSHDWHGMCGCEGHHGDHKHLVLRILLGLLILGMVFGVGLKVGEFKGELEAGGGFGFGPHFNMMRGYGWDNFGPMMPKNFDYRTPSSTLR